MFCKNRIFEIKLKINCKNIFFVNCFYCECLSNEMNINYVYFVVDIQVLNIFMCLWSVVVFFIEVLRKLEKSIIKMFSFVVVSLKYF